MRGMICLTVWLGLVAPLAAQPDPKAIIEQGIKAQGGAEKINRYPGARIRSQGSVVIQNTTFPFRSEVTYQMPGLYRSQFEFEVQGIKRQVIQIQNKDRIAMLVGELPQQVPPSQADEMKTALHVQNLARLTPLLKDPAFKLAALGEKPIAGKSLVGVQVASAGFPDVQLYFDPQEHLLTAIERVGHDAQGKEVKQLELFSQFREASGLKYPTKTSIRQNNARYIESETLEFRPLEKADAKLFALPAS